MNFTLMKVACLKNKRGILSFETLFFIELSVLILFFGHIEIAMESKKKIQELEKLRKSYDGIQLWKSY